MNYVFNSLSSSTQKFEISIQILDYLYQIIAIEDTLHFYSYIWLSIYYLSLYQTVQMFTLFHNVFGNIFFFNARTEFGTSFLFPSMQGPHLDFVYARCMWSVISYTFFIVRSLNLNFLSLQKLQFGFYFWQGFCN